MNSACLLQLFLLSVLIVSGMPRSLLAGTISIGGDLLVESATTPARLEGGGKFDFPFAASVPDQGMVSGLVHIGNDAATTGVIRLSQLQFQSLRARGTGEISFTLSVDQDFAYAGPPRVDGTFSLSGSTTFTAFPQSSGGQVAGFLGVVLDPLPFSFAANSQSSFPQMQQFGTEGMLRGLVASETMSLRLLLSLHLSDNALSGGPSLEDSGAEFVSIGYTASAAPVPEPSTKILIGVGILFMGLAARALRIPPARNVGHKPTRG
jgi:hypothetical protein